MSGAGESPAPASASFGDRLASAVARRESQIVLGIDPDPSRLWPEALARTSEARAELAQSVAAAHESARAVLTAATPAPKGNGRPAATGAEPPRPPALEAAAAVLAHCLALIEAAAPACVAAKPQLACFERLGFAGALALEAVCEAARSAGLLVLADGKRGDVPVTAAAYAQALTGRTPSPFGAVPGLEADALTANPLLGRDALEPIVAGARVTGATVPEHLARMRELMPRTPFLLPGVGAQGGDVRDLAPAFAAGRAGGLVTASRSIANAHEQGAGTPADAARAEAERLRELAWGLA